MFDEVRDRTEALSQEPEHTGIAHARPPRVPGMGMEDDDAPPPGVRTSIIDDEDINDEMLVMPLGPSGRNRGDSTASSPPTAWGNNGSSPLSHRHSSSKDWKSVAASGNGNGNGYGTQGKAKSMISIEKGGEGTMRKGSIAIGRGTVRGKGSGSGVEAMGVTAAGFFSAPDAPPVPPRR